MATPPAEQQELDLLGRVQPRATHPVIQRCREKHGGLYCILIYAKDMTTIVRTEDCRYWCPLLNERIE